MSRYSDGASDRLSIALEAYLEEHSVSELIKLIADIIEDKEESYL